MQDGHKKTDKNNNGCNLKVIAYEELPLDQADKLPRPISMPVPQPPVLPTFVVRTGDTIPAPWGAQESPRRERERRDTHPYSPFSDSADQADTKHSSSPTISGIRMQTLTPAERDEIEETNRNAAMISENMRASLQPGRLPNLTDIFADDEEVTGLVEESSLFAETAEPVKRTLAETVVAPDRPGTASDQKQPQLDIEEDTLVEIEVGAQPRPEPRLPTATVSSTAPVQVPLTPSARPTPVPPAPPLPKISEPAPRQEVEKKPDTAAPLPQPAKKSLWGRMKSSVSETVAAASGAIGAFVRRHKSGVALAAATSLAAATGAGVLYQQDQQQEAQSAAPSHQTVDTPPAPSPLTAVAQSSNSANETASTVGGLESSPTDSTEKVARQDSKSDASSPDAPSATPEQLPKSRSFAKNLQESKSPLVQDILNQGETTLQGSILSNTMLMPFVGLANNAQKAELSKLQRSINLGMGVFFNEHFGTAAKTAESLKDPNLRALHSTAKVMKEKGWAPASLTKEKYPEEYRLAAQIFRDGHELGLDRTDNPDPKVQDRVNGNMFQAKHNGDNIKLRKDNGQYHIVLEAVFGIFEGKSFKEALQTLDSTKAPSNNAEGNLAGNPDLTQRSTSGGIDEITDNPSEESSVPPETAPTSTFLQNSIGGSNSGGHGVSREARKIFSQRPDTSEIDAEWQELFEKQDLLKAERKTLEKEQLMDLTVPVGLKPSELHGILPAAVGEKLAELYPQADREKVIGIVKRYGFIGFRLVSSDRENGRYRVQFFKNTFRIIKEVLDKKAVKKADRLS